MGNNLTLCAVIGVVLATKDVSALAADRSKPEATPPVAKMEKLTGEVALENAGKEKPCCPPGKKGDCAAKKKSK